MAAMESVEVAQADSPSAERSTDRRGPAPGAQGSGAWGRARQRRKGGREWENVLESKRRKVGVDMEKCCSNRRE